MMNFIMNVFLLLYVYMSRKREGDKSEDDDSSLEGNMDILAKHVF